MYVDVCVGRFVFIYSLEFRASFLSFRAAHGVPTGGVWSRAMAHTVYTVGQQLASASHFHTTRLFGGRGAGETSTHVH